MRMIPRKILLLEDRPDVVASTRGLMEAYGLELLSASTVEEARDLMEEHSDDIGIALIDKNLGVGESAGLDFIEKMCPRYPDTEFFLITAWDLQQEERRRVQEAGVTVLPKSSISGRELVRICGGRSGDDMDIEELSLLLDEEESLSSETPDELLADTREELLESRLQAETMKHRAKELKDTISLVSREVVAQLRRDQSEDIPGILLNGESVSINDLVHEVETASPLGLQLLESHFRVMNHLLSRRG